MAPWGGNKAPRGSQEGPKRPKRAPRRLRQESGGVRCEGPSKRTFSSPSWGPLGALLGASWIHLGALLEPSGGPLGAFVRPSDGSKTAPGSSRQKSFFLELLGDLLGPSWNALGAVLGTSRSRLGPSWSRLGAFRRGPSGPQDGSEKGPNPALWHNAGLGPSWGPLVLGPLGAVLGPSWNRLGAPPEALLGFSWSPAETS